MATAPETKDLKDKKTKKAKKVRKNVVRGIAHVKASFNNTIVTITDTNGETLAWDSAGTMGFKGARKSTPFAATRAGESCAQKARKLGVVECEVRIKGAGSGRESAINGIVSSGIKVTALEDHTPVPHNGCRPRKRRRV
jgi:small subunit ribosomal protein S11